MIVFMTSAVMNYNELHQNVQVREIHIRKMQASLQLQEKIKVLGGCIQAFFKVTTCYINTHIHTLLSSLPGREL